MCVVCVFVGGLRDRQTVKDEPGYARPVPMDFKFSRHFVYIGRLFQMNVISATSVSL